MTKQIIQNDQHNVRSELISIIQKKTNPMAKMSFYLKSVMSSSLLTILLFLLNSTITHAQTADFSLNPSSGCGIPLSVSFTDQSIIPDTWFWQFGDGGTSTLQNPVHNYTSGGVFTVTLMIADTNTGVTDTHMDMVTVTPTVANFSASSAFGCGPLTVDFTDASSVSGPATLTGWNWDFGDGATSTNQNPSHVYQKPGIYTVSLTTSTDNGCTKTETKTNFIQLIGPDVGFSVNSNTVAEAPSSISFTNRTVSGAPIISWTWDFGDGVNSNLQNPTHIYTTVGSFNVSLTVADIDGCSRTHTKTNFVNTISGAFDITQAIFEGNENRFSVAGQESEPRSMAFNRDGTKMFVMGSNGDYINEYNLSVAYDVTTAVFAGNSERFSVAAQETFPRSLSFNNDGTKMFVVGIVGDDVNEYNLSTAFDVSSAVFAGNGKRFSVAVQETSPTSLTFNPDGTKMFVAGSDDDEVNEYMLSNAFDVATATYVRRLSVGAQDLFPQSILFINNGFKLLVMGSAGDDINQYNLTTAYDLSSASFAGNGERFSVASRDNQPNSLAFSPDGTKMYVLGVEGRDINQYSLSAPVITGATASQTINDEATLSPFLAITIQDPNGDNVSATITLDDNAKGVLTGTGLSGSGPYTLASRDAASLQTALRSLIFNPSDNRTAVSETSTFALTVSDGTLSDIDNITTVISSATAPTVTITSAATDPVNGTFGITVAFSEAVTGFDVSDLMIVNGTTDNFTATSALIYTANITPLADGSVTVDIQAASAVDTGGAENIAATQFSIVADLTDPTVLITSSETNPTNNNPIPVTITFSEEVIGFAITDLTIGNGSAGNFVTADNIVFTADITPAADGNVTMDIASDIAQDLAGNDNEAATQFSILYDDTDPAISITSSETSPSNSNPIPITIKFNEEVTGFDLTDLTIGNGSANNFVTADNITFSADITPAADGNITVDIAADIAQDLAGNDNETAIQFNILYDNTDPTITITSSETSPSNNNPIPVTITFSEEVPGFNLTDLTIGNGSAGNFATADIIVFTADITPAADGNVTVDINDAIAQDLAGNDNEAATQYSILYDGTDPTVAISSTENTLTNDNPIPVTITFSEEVTGFDLTDLTIGNGTAGNFATTDNIVFTADITSASDGNVTVDINAAIAQDLAGNNNEAATQFNILYDDTDPAISITSSETSPSNSNAIPVTITFSEEVTGFDLTDLTIGNGNASNLATTDNIVFTADITPAADGNVIVDINATIAQDLAGNNNEAATQFSILYDNTDPAVTITSSETSPSNSNAIPVTITFSEEVTGFALTDLTIGNGSVSNFATTDNIVFTADIIPATDGNVTVDINATIAQDLAGNDNEAATQFSILYDNTDPAVTITSSETNPTNNNSIPVIITFTEEVTGFTLTDLTIGNGSASNFLSADNITFTADITPVSDGIVTINISSAIVKDLAGNDNEAANQFSILYDNTDPTITFTSSETSPSNSNTIPVTITFSEEVTGFEIGDLTINNGTVSNFATTDNITFTADITPINDGNVTLDITSDIAQDLAENNNEAANQFSILYDNTDPAILIMSSESSPSNNNQIPVTITFTEEVTGFTLTDLTIGNGSASNFLSADNITFTADITPVSDGIVTINISSAIVKDLAGNDNEATNQFSILYDNTDPTITITSSETSPSNSNTIPVTITFSEEVAGFEIGDLTINNGTVSNFATTNNITFTADITPINDGNVTLDITSANAKDLAENNNEAANQFSILYDNTDPAILIMSSESSPSNNNPIPVTITFTEEVTGFDLTDLTIGNGSASNFTTADNILFTVDITPAADGNVTVDIASDMAQDLAGNDNEAANQFSILYDNTRPTVQIINTPDLVNDTNPFTINFLFSESTGSFIAADITLTNASAGNLQSISPNEYSAEITPDGNGDISIQLLADEVDDLSGNGNTISNLVEIDFNYAPVAETESYITFNNVNLIVSVSDGVLSNDSDPDGNPLKALLVNTVERGTLTLNDDGSFLYVPEAGFEGIVTFDYRASDSNLQSAISTTSITVNQENRIPSFTIGNDVIVLEDAGSIRIETWATNISDGDKEIQDLNFSITGNSNSELFSSLPAVSSDGSLTFSLAENIFGSAKIRITLIDDGNVNSTSEESSFNIIVSPVNDQPQINLIDDITIDAGNNGSIALTGIKSGAFNENQSLTVVVSTDRPDLISDLNVEYDSPDENGSITFNTQGNISAIATITLTVSDDGDLMNGGINEFTTSFVINIEEVVTGNLFLPSLFSPNNDGNNDKFIVRGTGIERIELVISDIEGNEVYRTSNINEATTEGWNGSINGGNNAQSGTYIWSIQGSFSNEIPLMVNGKQTGLIRLIR